MLGMRYICLFIDSIITLIGTNVFLNIRELKLGWMYGIVQNILAQTSNNNTIWNTNKWL
jgi:hypothetical protein